MAVAPNGASPPRQKIGVDGRGDVESLERSTFQRCQFVPGTKRVNTSTVRLLSCIGPALYGFRELCLLNSDLLLTRGGAVIDARPALDADACVLSFHFLFSY